MEFRQIQTFMQIAQVKNFSKNRRITRLFAICRDSTDPSVRNRIGSAVI
jgi:hypothetical protein